MHYVFDRVKIFTPVISFDLFLSPMRLPAPEMGANLKSRVISGHTLMMIVGRGLAMITDVQDKSPTDINPLNEKDRTDSQWDCAMCFSGQKEYTGQDHIH